MPIKHFLELPADIKLHIADQLPACSLSILAQTSKAAYGVFNSHLYKREANRAWKLPGILDSDFRGHEMLNRMAITGRVGAVRKFLECLPPETDHCFIILNAREYAIDRGHADIGQLLFEGSFRYCSGQDWVWAQLKDKFLINACGRGDKNLVELFLLAGAEVNSSSAYHVKALQKAVAAWTPQKFKFVFIPYTEGEKTQKRIENLKMLEEVSAVYGGTDSGFASTSPPNLTGTENNSTSVCGTNVDSWDTQYNAIGEDVERDNKWDKFPKPDQHSVIDLMRSYRNYFREQGSYVTVPIEDHEQFALLDLLINCFGADVQTRDSGGRSLLHYVDMHDKIGKEEEISALFEYVLSQGVFVDFCDHSDNRRTLLGSLCARKDHLELNLRWIKTLINFGADVNYEDAQGLTPLFLALRCSYGSKLTHPGHRIELLNTLIAAGAYPKHVVPPTSWSGGSNLIYEAVAHLSEPEVLEILPVLLTCGVTVNEEAGNHSTLVEATTRGYYEVVKILLESQEPPTMSQAHYALGFTKGWIERYNLQDYAIASRWNDTIHCVMLLEEFLKVPEDKRWRVPKIQEKDDGIHDAGGWDMPEMEVAARESYNWDQGEDEEDENDYENEMDIAQDSEDEDYNGLDEFSDLSYGSEEVDSITDTDGVEA